MTIRVEGFAELAAKLKTLQTKTRRSYIRSATRAGGRLVQDEVVRQAPTGPSKKSPDDAHLKDNILLKLDQRASTSYSVLYRLGVKHSIYWAIMLEYGTQGVGLVRAAGFTTRKHGLSPGTRRVGGSSPSKTFVNRDGQFFKTFIHKGYSERPFFRPAWEATKDHSLVAMGEVLKKRMGLT